MTVLELVERIQDLMDCRHIPLDIRNTAVGEIHSQYLDASKRGSGCTGRPGAR
jgi:hypothetical protein